MNPANAIELHGVQVHAGGRRLLSVEHLAIGGGKTVALMGPNGAGKTTLLRACLGLARHVDGEIRVLGQDVLRLSGPALADLRRRIGYVPQLLPMRSELPITVREVVAIARTARVGILRSFSRKDWDVVDEWIERLGLSAIAMQSFASISGGEQRKTIIARAMAQEPELLLLDEPTANLDLGWRERIVEAIHHIHVTTGIGIVLVCHELEVLPPSCHRVILVRAGRVVADGSPETVFTAARVNDLYGPGLRALHEAGRHALVPVGHSND